MTESTAEDPEEFAEEVGVDPTPQEVDEYRERVGDPPPQPQPEPEEPPD
ncbi:MAG TPA: hypothetical protein VGX25_00245 [Actinophytocola sp.]|nr:hypothetical protein [Actinophytocola sp.]HEV2777807.1 hypothetical protein [Actinophytocola sp.]